MSVLRVRKTGGLLLISGALALAAALNAQAPPPAPATPAGRADVGRTLYTKTGCFQCHGNEGQGGAAGPRLGPRPIPFAAFAAYVRRPLNDMPPYTAKVMTDRDLADIYAFLHALPQPADVSNIPLLQP